MSNVDLWAKRAMKCHSTTSKPTETITNFVLNSQYDIDNLPGCCCCRCCLSTNLRPAAMRRIYNAHSTYNNHDVRICLPSSCSRQQNTRKRNEKSKSPSPPPSNIPIPGSNAIPFSPHSDSHINDEPKNISNATPTTPRAFLREAWHGTRCRLFYCIILLSKFRLFESRANCPKKNEEQEIIYWKEQRLAEKGSVQCKNGTNIVAFNLHKTFSPFVYNNICRLREACQWLPPASQATANMVLVEDSNFEYSEVGRDMEKLSPFHLNRHNKTIVINTGKKISKENETMPCTWRAASKNQKKILALILRLHSTHPLSNMYLYIIYI